MPRHDAMGERFSIAFVGVLATAAIATIAPTRAAELPRIASINACTDQLLLALADPDQILGLGPYSRDATRAWSAAAARRYPRLSGEAEDVLVLKPDVVVAGSFTKRATRELLKEQGQKVVTFDVAHSLDEVRAQIRKMGEVTRHPDRAETYIAHIDAALARTRQFVAKHRYRVLSISRRGWVAGSRSLMSSLLAEIGLTNAAGELGLKFGGFASLEAIVKLQPDYIVISNDSDFAEDEGRAFLLHPALEHFYPPSKRLVVPERLTVCGGPMVVDALDRIVSEIMRAEREAGTTSAAH
jgi:iron complex transport system substrate-binding protein